MDFSGNFKKTVECNLTADQWQIPSSLVNREDVPLSVNVNRRHVAALAFNEVFTRLVNEGVSRDDLQRAMTEKMHFYLGIKGAADSPRKVFDYLLDMALDE